MCAYVQTELRGARDSDYTDMHSADSSMATAGREYLTHELDQFLRSAKKQCIQYDNMFQSRKFSVESFFMGQGAGDYPLD